MDAGPPTAAGEGEQGCRLRVVLAGISPLIWRQLDVAASATLAGLRPILQTAFGWSGEHRFTVRGVGYRACQGPGLLDGEDAGGVTLTELGLRVSERFTYDYAFFSGLQTWRHDVRVQAIEPARLRRCYPGAAAGPAAHPRRNAADRSPSWPCARSIPAGRPPCRWLSWFTSWWKPRKPRPARRCARCWVRTPSRSCPTCCIGPGSTVPARPQ